jgi:hypothetical protein
MTARTDHERREELDRTGISVGLWFAVLGGPAAGLADVLVNYPAVDRACVGNSSVLLHVLTILFLLIAIVAGVMSWRFRERIGVWPSTAAGPVVRGSFMATLGLLTATVAVFGIILEWIPIFFLRACTGS